MSYSYGVAAETSVFDTFSRKMLFKSFLLSDFWIRSFQSTGEFQRSLNKDVDLCYTFSRKRNDATIYSLMANEISFTQKTINIPFFLRSRFHNMKRIYILQVNRNCYDDACYVIRRMDPQMRCKLKEAAY